MGAQLPGLMCQLTAVGAPPLPLTCPLLLPVPLLMPTPLPMLLKTLRGPPWSAWWLVWSLGWYLHAAS